MGIQAFIELSQIPTGITIETEVEVDTYADEYGDEQEYRIVTTTLVASDGSSKTFNTSTDVIWVDANVWGSNRAHYLPWLDKHGVPYTLG